MPLAATIDDERIEAHRVSDEEWVSLKSRYKRGSLILACGERAIPKTNRHGTKFFAHKPGLDCSRHEGGPESSYHLDAKARIAEAAREAGWTATLEFSGPGRSWIADVMVENGHHRIAIEIQWSSQSSADFARRQKKYEDSGVKCFWFINVKNERAALEANVPFATFWGSGVGWAEMTFLEPPENGSYPALDEAVRHVLAFEYRRKFQPIRVGAELGLERHYCPGCSQESVCFFVDRVQVSTPCGADISFYSQQRISLQSYGDHDPNGPERALRNQVHREFQARRVGAAAVVDGAWGERVSFSCAHCGRGLPRTATSWRNHRQSLYIADMPSLRLYAGLTTVRHICLDRGQGKCSQTDDRSYDRTLAFYGRPLQLLAMEAARGRKTRR